jgi:hypothetical protein
VRPRRQRWISIPEVLESLAKNYPAFVAKLEGKPRKRQLEVVRRLVRRAERRDACRFTKRVDGDIFVNVDTLESLLPVDVEKVAAVERDVENLHERHRGLERRVNGHGSKLRDHDKRLALLEAEQQLTSKYLADLQAIRAAAGRAGGAP